VTEVVVAFRAELDDFGSFYEASYAVAYRTALAIVRDAGLAADVTQDAYVQAFRDRARFRGDAPATAWFHRIVVNAALAGLRRRSSRPREIPARELQADLGGDQAGAASERLSILAALDDLEPRSRAAVVLRYYLDYDYATIGRILGTSPGNVGVILTRALDRLRAVLEPEPIGGAR
jgi:RNA polymerase sigma factor (sigma-70 family)